MKCSRLERKLFRFGNHGKKINDNVFAAQLDSGVGPCGSRAWGHVLRRERPIMKIRMRKVDWEAGVRFYIHEGQKYVSKMIFKNMNECEVIEDSGYMSNEDAQVLMDDLWNVGLRPTEGTGSAGAMAATQNHLKDLQRLVFKGKG